MEIFRDSFSMPLGTTDGDERLTRPFTEIMFIDDDEELESEDEFEM